MRAVIFSLIFALVGPNNALAWGSAGHKIIAEIAEQYLEPETATPVRDLLGMQHATNLAEVANWADEIRRQRPETARWHYVDSARPSCARRTRWVCVSA